MQFNDALVESSHRVTLAGRAFGVAAGKAIGGGVMEVAKVKREHENMVEALERAQAEMKVIRVPDSPSARRLFEEFRKMMVVMDEVVREDFKSIVKVLEDPLLTSTTSGRWTWARRMNSSRPSRRSPPSSDLRPKVST